jgi:hypothetical protein
MHEIHDAIRNQSNSILRLAFALCITDDLSNPMLSIHIAMPDPLDASA